MCGLDHWRWTAYGFASSDFEVSLKVKDPDEDWPFLEDPIAGATEELPIMDANSPILDPRQYFLAVFAIRTALVHKEWQNLTRWLKRQIEEHVR
jgi:hypothetical protein